jgi:glutamate synthase (NADPH) large chain
MPQVPAVVPRRHTEAGSRPGEGARQQLIELARPALERGRRCRSICRSATSTAPSARCCRARSRAATAMTAARGHHPHPLTGTAGQSFGAFLARGITLDLVGEANDYVGKGLSGGASSCARRNDFRGEPTENIIVGNTCCTARSRARCSSRAWPASASACATRARTAVVEGVGDHGCEYMTGGTVVVLGETGRNFAAGMSGGIAYVLDRTASSRALQHGDGRLEPVPDGSQHARVEPVTIWHRSVRRDHLEMGDEKHPQGADRAPSALHRQPVRPQADPRQLAHLRDARGS